jgi:hypothetical protein
MFARIEPNIAKSKTRFHNLDVFLHSEITKYARTIVMQRNAPLFIEKMEAKNIRMRKEYL